jgi:hypothetical protein
MVAVERRAFRREGVAAPSREGVYEAACEARQIELKFSGKNAVNVKHGRRHRCARRLSGLTRCPPIAVSSAPSQMKFE